MKKTAIALALAGAVLTGAPALAATGSYGVGDYYNFTRAYIGQVTNGVYDAQPVFVGNPGNSIARLAQSQYFPTLTGTIVNLPIPSGSHGSTFYQTFTSLEIGRVTQLLTNAGVIGGGKGVPAPIAGAGLPLLALAAAAVLRRRRTGRGEQALLPA